MFWHRFHKFLAVLSNISSRNHMATIVPMGLVRVLQSFPTRCVLTILHKFSMGFMSGEFPGQSKTLIPYSSKIASLLLQNDREQIVFKNIPSSYKRSFHFSNHFLLYHLTLFCRIHHPCNRIK